MRKKYAYAYKKYAFAHKIFTCAGLFYIMLYTEHAYFLCEAKYKIRTRYSNFSGIYKENFLRCDVTRFFGVVVRLLVFKKFNLDSILTKIKILNFCTNVVNFFCNQFLICCLEIFTKFLKVGLRYLNNRSFFFLVFSSLSNQIFHSCYNNQTKSFNNQIF